LTLWLSTIPAEGLASRPTRSRSAITSAEQYAQTFREHAIDADVLRDLPDEHLRELSLPLGARLKLLRAVAALGTELATHFLKAFFNPGVSFPLVEDAQSALDQILSAYLRNPR
jgi:hypothetical protein